MWVYIIININIIIIMATATANCCIVSAFLTNVNRRKDRTIEKYLDFGKQLLALDKIPKIVFLERVVYFVLFGLTSADVQ